MSNSIQEQINALIKIIASLGHIPSEDITDYVVNGKDNMKKLHAKNKISHK